VQKALQAQASAANASAASHQNTSRVEGQGWERVEDWGEYEKDVAEPKTRKRRGVVPLLVIASVLCFGAMTDLLIIILAGRRQ